MMGTALSLDKPSGDQGVVAYSKVTGQASGITYFGSPTATANAVMQNLVSKNNEPAGLFGRSQTFTPANLAKAQAAETAFGDFIKLVLGVGPNGRYVLSSTLHD